MTVGHPQRLKHAPAKELIEGKPGHNLDQPPQHINGDAVLVALSRVEQQGKTRQRSDAVCGNPVVLECTVGDTGLSVHRAEDRVGPVINHAAVWVSRCQIVTSRAVGTVYGSRVAVLTRTFGFLNSGRNPDTGSVSRNRPSSCSIITAAVVMGFVIEQMRKTESVRIGLPDSMSAIPYPEPCHAAVPRNERDDTRDPFPFNLAFDKGSDATETF